MFFELNCIKENFTLRTLTDHKNGQIYLKFIRKQFKNQLNANE